MGCFESSIEENNDLTPEMEKYLSDFKLTCYNLHDEKLRTSQFEFIIEDFSRKFDKTISIETLYAYYNC